DPLLFRAGDDNLYRWESNTTVNMLDPSGCQPVGFWYPGRPGPFGNPPGKPMPPQPLPPAPKPPAAQAPPSLAGVTLVIDPVLGHPPTVCPTIIIRPGQPDRTFVTIHFGVTLNVPPPPAGC